ncbi:hypothetical protein Egran_04225 [Elaphomyces granulatus]|uniref:Xylanolytic transcriptional activator regulatory domain-containing protein n=1 Tax=Elaphomyces granulatus TaxID=519963 RepID=A0A232LV35_9EURO|nr:hypothetical protein Egran_04225 [Elaphomyces granulatus]
MAAVISFQPSSAAAAANAAAAAVIQKSRASVIPAQHQQNQGQHQQHQHQHQLLRPGAPQMVAAASTSASISDASSSSTTVTSLSTLSRGSSRDGSSCDACLRRKSRCAINESIKKCYSCEFHRQECTFTMANSSSNPIHSNPVDLQPRKRKLDETTDGQPIKRFSRDTSCSPVLGAKEMSQAQSNATETASPKLACQSSQHIGLTTEFETALLEHLPLDANDESLLVTARVRKLGDDGTFMWLVDDNSSGDSQCVTLDAVEDLVAPYGSTLVEKFFQHIHPVFPILTEDTFHQSYRTRKGLSPLLLSAVYLLALKFLDINSASQTVRVPDASRLESTAMKLLTESLPRAHLPTIQAGLLLMQKSSLSTPALNAQLVTAGFELGLHQDCSNWKIGLAERGLRKRLAWALYLQDKWASLVHGRPSHISAANWTVRDLVDEDFIAAFPAIKQEECSMASHGPLVFCHQVVLAAILSDILESFYTLKATEMFNASGNNQTRLILEKAKPVQIRLKEFFANLPPQLKMDLETPSPNETACNGALHLAYFATEITLHRCIVRSLQPETADNYLSHICRSAAKTRLISAMDFVNRLRPPHLKAFWPAPSRTNFALIGSFGILLQVTAPTAEEAEFYHLRLGEYRWTLSASVKNAEFLHFAIDSLDLAMGLVTNVPEKPGIEELMAGSSRAASCRAWPISLMDEREDAILDAQPMLDAARVGSSVVSSLASPATSVSSGDSIQDVYIPTI